MGAGDQGFLASRKAQERELAIRVMRSWGAEQYREELQRALETEKSKKLKELLQNTLGASAPDEAQRPRRDSSNGAGAGCGNFEGRQKEESCLGL